MNSFMWLTRKLIFLALPVFLICCFRLSLIAGKNDQQIRTVVNLVLVNVSVLDNETQHPVRGLTNHDFQIFDNGSLVRPVVFLAGSSPDRSTTIWFLATCSNTSGWITGPLKSALAKLDSTYSFGVAHWCGADANIDVPPTPDREAVLTAIDNVFRLTRRDSSGNIAKFGFQSAVHLVAGNSQGNPAQSLPVIVLLAEGKLSMSNEEVDLTAKRLLYNGDILYPITGDVPFAHSETVELPEQAYRVRLMVTDSTTGKAGSQDFLMKEILNGSRNAAIIR